MAFDWQSGGDARGLTPKPTAQLQRGQVPANCFTSKDSGQDAELDLSPTLRAGAHAGSHANAGVPPAVAFQLRGREDGAQPEIHGDGSTTGALRAADGGSSRDYVASMAVRRLTPVECSRLQGFPDYFTQIPYRGKPSTNCPDGPQYRAIGNSMAVTCMAWLGERIDAHVKGRDKATVDAIAKQLTTP